MSQEEPKEHEDVKSKDETEAVQPAEDADKKPAEDAGDKPAEKPAEKSPTAPPLPEGTHYIWGTGRRKKSVARVRIRPGSGQILINKRKVDEYFTQDKDREVVIAPLQVAGMVKSWDVWVNVGGGGNTGQAGAVTMGLARALARAMATAMPEVELKLRDQGLLTRDARMKERKKYGQRGARRRFQFSKR